MGSIEAGLAVTTVNPAYNSEEISRQLKSSKPKLIFSLVDNYAIVQKACELADQPDTLIVTIKIGVNQTLQTGMIDFFELINRKGKLAANDLTTLILVVRRVEFRSDELCP